MRRLRRGCLGAAIGAIVLVALGKLALASSYVGQQAVLRLQAAVGAPVRIGQVDVGFSSSQLGDVRVLENRQASDQSWVAAGSIDAGLSLWQLVTGDLGRGIIRIRDLDVKLLFDERNMLLTALPTPPVEQAGALPTVIVENGRFTLGFAGKPDETFHKIQLELRREGQALRIRGTADDPDWGPWTLTGGQDAPDAPLILVLRTAREVHATMPLLRRTPFVPASVWREVEVEGDTTCEVTVRIDPKADRVHYKVDLHPRATKVFVRIAALNANGASGQVIVEDDVVTLKDVRGLAAGGDLKLQSRMDFRTVPNRLAFALEAEKMQLRQLPTEWNVPPIQGKVSGKAQLELGLDYHRMTASGQGEGAVQAFPFLPPIRLQMVADDRGLRFQLKRD